MAVKQRIMEVCWDVVNKTFRDFTTGADLGVKSTPAYIHYHEKPLMRLKLVKDASLTACSDYDGLSLYAIVKASYDPDLAPVCENLAATINQTGDWENDATASAALGQFTFQMDGFTAPFNTQRGLNYKIKNTTFSLYGLVTECGDIMAVNEFDFDCLNIRMATGGAPAPVEDYPTWAQAEAAFAPIIPLAGTQTSLPIATTNVTLGAAAAYRAFHVTGVIDGDGKYTVLDMHVMHNGSTATVYKTANGDDISSLVTITADINGGNVRLNLANITATRKFVYGVFAYVRTSA